MASSSLSHTFPLLLTASNLLLCPWLHPSTQSLLFKPNAVSMLASLSTLPPLCRSVLFQSFSLSPKAPPLECAAFPQPRPWPRPGALPARSSHAFQACGFPRRFGTPSARLGSPRVPALATPRASSLSEPRLLGCQLGPSGFAAYTWLHLMATPPGRFWPSRWNVFRFAVPLPLRLWPRLGAPPQPSHTSWTCALPVTLAARALWPSELWPSEPWPSKGRPAGPAQPWRLRHFPRKVGILGRPLKVAPVWPVRPPRRPQGSTVATGNGSAGRQDHGDAV